MLNNCGSHTLLVTMQNSITMLENNFAVSLKVKQIQPYDQSILALGINPRRKKSMSPQRLDANICIRLICNSQNWKQYKCTSPDK